MAEATDNLVLEHLRHMRGKLDQVWDDIGMMKLHMAAMERHLSGQLVTEFTQNEELGRLKQRVERIERRLELAD